MTSAIARRGRLGCSEIAAAMGLSPWKTPLRLWEEKTGAVERAEESRRQRRLRACLADWHASFEAVPGLLERI